MEIRYANLLSRGLYSTRNVISSRVGAIREQKGSKNGHFVSRYVFPRCVQRRSEGKKRVQQSVHR